MPAQAARTSQTAEIPLGLYVHLPWCVRKCPYCDFNSHTAPGEIPAERYVDALLSDLELAAGGAHGRPITSVFIGGGTPSLFPPGAIARLLEGVDRAVPLARNAEITLEANPGTTEQARFSGFLTAGVNRLSIGVQSFDDAMLARLGRIHDAAAAATAVRAAAAAGFEAINLDLMYALPGQGVDAAIADIDRALTLGTGHISHYQLTLEPGTPFAARPPRLPDPDHAHDMQLACQAHLAAAGLQQYEISGYAQPGQECRHNLNYWRFGDYLGIGAGAHGKVTDPATGTIERTARQRHPNRYMRDAGTPESVAERRIVGRGELPLEFMMNALRLNEPLSPALWEARTGCPWSDVAETIEAACADGYLTATPAGYRKTERGSAFLDELLMRFMESP